MTRPRSARPVPSFELIGRMFGTGIGHQTMRIVNSNRDRAGRDAPRLAKTYSSLITDFTFSTSSGVASRS